MKKLVAIVLAGATALSMPLAIAAPAVAHNYDSVRHHDRYDRHYRTWERDRHRELRRWESHRWESHRWDRRYTPRGFYGPHPYFNTYGDYRVGQVYRYHGHRRYEISDYHRYGLPAPRPGYRYYRDDRGNVIMAAIAGGVIGLIIGGVLD